MKLVDGLQGDFCPFTKTEYDEENSVIPLNKKMGDFVGTNCRIEYFVYYW